MTIKVVSSQTHTDVEREQTLGDFKWAARELAANVLRLVRGGGKAYEIPENIDNLYHAMARYREVHHAYPSQYEWNRALHANKAWSELRPRWDPDNINFKDMDEGDRLAFDQMIAISGIRDGMLQMAASMLIHQVPQQAAGEREFYQSFHELVDLRERSRKHYQRLSGHPGETERVLAKLRRAAEAAKKAKPKKRKPPPKPRPVT